MVILNFKALTQKKYRLVIFLIILAILIPAILFMVYVVTNQIIHLKRFQLVGILGLPGMLSFFILGFVVNKTLGKNFALHFNEKDLTIAAEKMESINYTDIESISIYNNSDYSKIIFQKMDGTNYKLFVGMANLLSNKNILEPATLLDDVLKKYFDKEVTHRKTMEIINFTRKHLTN